MNKSDNFDITKHVDFKNYFNNMVYKTQACQYCQEENPVLFQSKEVVPIPIQEQIDRTAETIHRNEYLDKILQNLVMETELEISENKARDLEIMQERDQELKMKIKQELMHELDEQKSAELRKYLLLRQEHIIEEEQMLKDKMLSESTTNPIQDDLLEQIQILKQEQNEILKLLKSKSKTKTDKRKQLSDKRKESSVLKSKAKPEAEQN